MSMRKSDIMRTEFIGLEAEVLSAPCYKGISGTVLDETKNVFVIGSAEKARMVPKKGNEFAFTYNEKIIVIKGSEILYRPEDRIKKIR